MRTGKRSVKNGQFYDRFFERAKGKNITVKKEATLRDTMKWIKIVVNNFKGQSKKITRHLKARSVRQTCFNIWKFCFEHFQYEKDEKRTEQIRTPNRSWYDRHSHKGIDCDCFSTIIGTMLVLAKIPFVFRLTKYESTEFEHIYPVAFDEEGNEIIIDCVVHGFNYEVPYTEKLDEEMELQILNGMDDLPIDAQDLFLNEDFELDGLEGKAEREARKAKRKDKRATRKETPLKERIRNGITKINKVNPATILLRTGILASMKLNLFKVASSLRFAYWSDNQAAKNSVDLAKLNQLKRIREKVEMIYYRAGGKPENLEKAILQGRGNRNKMVALNGLGSISTYPTDYDDLKTILGDELYYQEGADNEGLDGLGEPVTGTAAVAAASGTMGVLAGLIKKIGDIFRKGSSAAKKFKAQDLADDAEEKTRRFSLKNIANKVRNKVQERRARKNGGELPDTDSNSEVITFENDEEFDIPEEDFEIILEDEFNLPSQNQTRQPTVFDDEQIDDSAEGITNEDGKKPNAVVAWIKENQAASWAIGGVTAIGLGILGYRVIKNRKAKPKKKSSTAMNGVYKKKKSTVKKTAARKRTTRRVKPKTSTAPRKKTARRKVTTRRKPTTRLKEISLK